LAESLILCVSGAIVGVLIAGPMVDILAHYAARFSVRALDLSLDASLLWVGAALAVAAALLLAFVPRLPSSDTSHGFGLTNGSIRITGSTNRRLRAFAVVQIAASFVLLAGAGMLLRTLVEGRDFTDADNKDSERVVIVSAALAQRLFPGQDPINRHLTWTDPIMKFIGVSTDARRIVGVAADVNDETIDGSAGMLVYHP